MKPLVSIITPCYNGEKFVHRFLDSIVNQTYPNIELIFINDGSTDKTEDVVLSYRDLFGEKGIEFKYIYQENKGQAAALNQGLKIFKGEYLTWPDSDDILHQENISLKVNFLENNSNYGLVMCKSYILDEENLEVIGELKRVVTDESNDDLFSDLIIGKNVYFAPGGYMVRTSAFEEVIPSREIYASRGGQNWQILLQITYSYRCGYIDEYLYNYLVRGDSHSREAKNFNDEIKRFDAHQDILINTIKSTFAMSKKEKQHWIKYVNEKYLKLKFQSAAQHRHITKLDMYYEDMKKNEIVTGKDKVIYLRGKFGLINFLYCSLIIPYRVLKKGYRDLT